jgi:hypothetical protein
MNDPWPRLTYPHKVVFGEICEKLLTLQSCSIIEPVLIIVQLWIEASI